MRFYRRRAFLSLVGVCVSALLEACAGRRGAAPGQPTAQEMASPEATVTEAARPAAAVPGAGQRLLILHTNDVIGYVDPCG